jgi:hypothetical protein
MIEIFWYKTLISSFNLKTQTLICVRLAAGEECGTLILANFGVKLLWRHYWLKYKLALQLYNFLLDSEIGGYTLD